MWATGSLHRCTGDGVTSLCCILPRGTCHSHSRLDCPLPAGEPCDQYWHHYSATFLHRTDHYDLENAMDGDTVIFNWRPHGWNDYRLWRGRRIVGNWAMHCVLMTGTIGEVHDHNHRPVMCIVPDQVGGRERKFRADDIECTLFPAFVLECHRHLVHPPILFMGRAVAYSTVWNGGVLFASRFRLLEPQYQ